MSRRDQMRLAYCLLAISNGFGADFDGFNFANGLSRSSEEWYELLGIFYTEDPGYIPSDHERRVYAGLMSAAIFAGDLP